MNREEEERLQRLIRYTEYVGVDYAVAEAKTWWRKRMAQNVCVIGTVALYAWLAWRHWMWITTTTTGFFTSSLIGAVMLFLVASFVFHRLGPTRFHHYVLAYPFIALCRVAGAFLTLLVLARIAHYILISLGYAHSADGILQVPLHK